MARRRHRPNVAGAEKGLQQFKGQVMKNEGYDVDPANPEKVKYEVAGALGIPLREGYNGNLTSASAGKIGGKIGGTMVREMIRMAQEQLKNRSK